MPTESNCPNNQTKMVVELISKKILTPLEAKKRKIETVETHKESKEVNREKKRNDNVTISETLIDKYFILRKKRQKILEESKNFDNIP